MNKNIVSYFISEYKNEFHKVDKVEIYKWKAVKCFQDNWNIDAIDFHKMLMNSIRLTKNLLKSGKYFPLRMLEQYSEQEPEITRSLFKSLYDEEVDIYSRIENFIKETKELNENFPGNNSYQDHRAVVVYLTLRYPERYYLYKFNILKEIVQKFQISYKPIRGRIENVKQFQTICKMLKHEIEIDQDLLKLHKNRLDEDCYYDENLNLLTQDFLYSTVRHLSKNDEKRNSDKLIHTQVEYEIENAKNFVNRTSRPNFKGISINFEQLQKEKNKIGLEGELWVLEFEKYLLKTSNRLKLSEKVKHVSVNEGDGTGYDILSFHLDGSPKFIEVKTTRGKLSTPIYITNNELERSIKENKSYYLYRLYNYDDSKKKFDLKVIKGNLRNLCNSPSVYKVNLKT